MASSTLSQLAQLHLSKGALRRPSGEWPHCGGHVPYRPPISLPHLRDSLLDEDRIDRISYFLSHLPLQSSTILHIRMRVSDGGQTTDTIAAMLPPNRTTTLPALGLATDGHLTLRVRGGSEYNISRGYVRPHLDGPKNLKFPRVIFKLDPGNRSELWSRAVGPVGLDDLGLVSPRVRRPASSLTFTTQAVFALHELERGATSISFMGHC